ncbi:MAG: terminase small subunit [Oscillospiraceae bacterium]|nr:terminase small subunit [Oscillospiraceae bacterium]
MAEQESREQVVDFLFAVMQGEPTKKEQLKAAELLGKHLGMFEKREDKPEEPPVAFVGAEHLAD